MARNRARFEKGSGCFDCGVCGRKTRATGGDNDSVKLCEECYEIAGIENQISDQGSTPELLAEIESLKMRCVSKGGKLEGIENGKS